MNDAEILLKNSALSIQRVYGSLGCRVRAIGLKGTRVEELPPLSAVWGTCAIANPRTFRNQGLGPVLTKLMR